MKREEKKLSQMFLLLELLRLLLLLSLPLPMLLQLLQSMLMSEYNG